MGKKQKLNILLFPAPSLTQLLFENTFELINSITSFISKLMTQHGKGVAISTPVASTLSGVEDSITVGMIQQVSDDQSSNTIFAGEAIQQIEAIVELFRTRKVKKLQAIFQISQILEAEPTGSDELKSNSLECYAVTLDGIKALTAASSQHGQQVTESLLGKQKISPERGG